MIESSKKSGMRKRGRFGRRLMRVFAVFFALILVGVIYLYIVAIAHPPKQNDDAPTLALERTAKGNSYVLKNNWLRKSSSGLYEMWVGGEPFERGVINGKLSHELVVAQEDYFNEQITKLVPSTSYRNFLKYFIAWFNRNLEENVTEEYRREIYGVSASASKQYQYIGSNYQRILNYHAAHDIGHTLQNMALVGCTSFGTWNGKSADSSMIIGRNFDFYVSDKFARDKIVAFFSPSKGYKFMSVTWGGFIGVVSGMNEKGIAVTINAAKSDVPSGSATPVSLVTREILQYAKNIDEAVAIAKKRNMFVSESFLIASAADNKAVVIEKTPDQLDIYDPQQDHILCTNHFQSEKLKGTKDNVEQVQESASPYRYQRLTELLNSTGGNTVEKTIAILRDRKGIQGKDIGTGNEKAVNQMIAHHSIVFQPQQMKVWVSTDPWQLGPYVAYDLKKIFASNGVLPEHEIFDSSLSVVADTFLRSLEYRNFTAFRSFRQRIANSETIDPDSLVATNPEFYHTYVLAADYLFKRDEYARALKFYRIAATKVIATKKEEIHIRDRISKCQKKTDS